MTIDDEELTKRIAREISSYLERRDQATDTIEGIVDWWIVRQRLYEERQRVEKALEYLLQIGAVSRTVLPGGKIIYSGTKSRSR